MKNSKFIILFLILTTSVIIYSCKKDPKIVNGNSDGHSHTHIGVDNKNFPPAVIPSDNRLTVEGVRLGRMLFYEKMLSRNGSMSCASCHDQQTGFSDTNRFSIGVNGSPGTRQAMAVTNMIWNSNKFFWDGRADLLRHQSLMPITDPLEMDETLPNVVAKLEASEMYQTQFYEAFGSNGIDTVRISKALEQFMNSIVSNQSKYDDYLSGNATLTTLEERGRFLFFAEVTPSFPALSGADCAHCHSGLLFQNNKYMNNGLNTDASFTDIGREAVTGNAADRAKFKVTSLRNIELTPPYMHDGRFQNLRSVINHYDHNVKMSSTLDGTLLPTVGGLNLTEEDKDALIAFLKTLTDKTLATNPEYSNPF